MNILVTNDDGIEAAGIQKLIFSLSLLAKVYVFAPAQQQSAKGQSITIWEPLSVEKRKISGAEEAYAVSGTPTDCVKYGVQTLRDRNISIDFVVSGINMGLNLGADVRYSGTVGAAMEGASFGIRSIALSVEHHVPTYYDYICGMLSNLLDMSRELESTTVLNVNTPDLPAWKIQGTKITSAGPKRFLDQVVPDEKEENVFHYTGGHYEMAEDLSEDFDVRACAEGYATITPLETDCTDRAAIREMKRMTNQDVLCLFIDFQEHLVPVMRKSKELMKNVSKWARCAEALRMPVLLSQQYTRGLGPTVPELRDVLHEYNRLEKISFSCLDAPGFEEELQSMTGKHVVIAGIEAHICVYQTAVDFLDRGFQVTILKDCCGARKKVDFDTAMEELAKAGCRITTYETFVYQTLRTSRHTAFRTISEIVKE